MLTDNLTPKMIFEGIRVLSDRISMAEDVLSLMLTHFEDEHREIPNPSSINDLQTANGAFATCISCDTTVYRRLMKAELNLT